MADMADWLADNAAIPSQEQEDLQDYESAARRLREAPERTAHDKGHWLDDDDMDKEQFEKAAQALQRMRDSLDGGNDG